MFEEIKQMTTKELAQELRNVRHHIDNFSYGSYELNYEMALEKELNKRNNKV